MLNPCSNLTLLLPGIFLCRGTLVSIIIPLIPKHGGTAQGHSSHPPEGQKSDKVNFFPFLYDTSDLDEKNLYPFVHLSVDGNLFIFSNNLSLLLDPKSNKIVRTFPVLPGGSRNYTVSGMSALLPIKLDADGKANSTEVIVCGSNTPDAFYMAEALKQYLPAFQDCNRMVITDNAPAWESEMMPSRRTMGDLLNLPNGQLLFITGAQNYLDAWEREVAEERWNRELSR